MAGKEVDEPQAMSDERLEAITRRFHVAAGMPVEATTQIERDVLALLAEVERQRSQAILLQAQADGAAALLLEAQQDCVALRKQASVLTEVVRAVSEAKLGVFWEGQPIDFSRMDDVMERLQAQARAALASESE